MDKVCPFSADLPRWPLQPNSPSTLPSINSNVSLPINLSTLEPVSKTSLNFDEGSSTMPQLVSESVKNQLLLGESSKSQNLFNGFDGFNGYNVPLSVMLLREPIEQRPTPAPTLTWPGVEAVIESYRKYNKGKTSIF
jgi:hypothetical protein